MEESNCNYEYRVLEYRAYEYRLDARGNPIGHSAVKAVAAVEPERISGSVLTGTGYRYVSYRVLQ